MQNQLYSGIGGQILQYLVYGDKITRVLAILLLPLENFHSCINITRGVLPAVLSFRAEVKRIVVPLIQ